MRNPEDSEISNVALEPEGLRGEPQKEAEERLFLGWLFGRWVGMALNLIFSAFYRVSHVVAN